MANQNDIPEDNERSSTEPIPDWIKWFREHSIPIAGVIVVLLVICLFQPGSRINWTKAKDFTDAFRNVTQGWRSLQVVSGRTSSS